MYPWLKCWADCSAHWHKHPPASHLAGQKSFHTGTVNLHQYSQLCPCSRLCPLNNSLPVYFIPPEIRASSYPCRPTHWVAAQHSRVTSASSLQGHRRVAYSIRQIWAKKFNLLSSGWFQLSSLFPLHLLHLCVYVLVCAFSISVMSWWMGGQQSGGEGEREKGRGKAISPLPFYRSISSWKSPHLLQALLHSSLIVTGKTHFLSAPAPCVCVYVWVCLSVRESHRNGGKSSKLAAFAHEQLQ